MVIDGHGENPLGPFLPDDVLVEPSIDLLGRQYGGQRNLPGRGDRLSLQDLFAKIYALATDIHPARAGDEPGYLILPPMAEGAILGF